MCSFKIHSADMLLLWQQRRVYGVQQSSPHPHPSPLSHRLKHRAGKPVVCLLLQGQNLGYCSLGSCSAIYRMYCQAGNSITHTKKKNKESKKNTKADKKKKKYCGHAALWCSFQLALTWKTGKSVSSWLWQKKKKQKKKIIRFCSETPLQLLLSGLWF